MSTTEVHLRKIFLTRSLVALIYSTELHSMLASIAFQGLREVRCWIHRNNDGTKLEEQWQGSFHWRGLGFSDFFFFLLLLLVWFWERSLRGHLHGDAGEESPPSGGVLLGLESGMGRGTGRATGGGGGSKKEPGILLWPLPFGCRQHK